MNCPRCNNEILNSTVCQNCGYTIEDTTDVENIIDEVIEDVNNDRENQLKKEGKAHEFVFYIAILVALIVMIIIIVNLFSDGHVFFGIVGIIATPFISGFAGKTAENIYTK